LVSLVKRDIVAPNESVDALALAIEQRVRHADNPIPFEPTAGGAFTHATTSTTRVISATPSSTLFTASATAMTSGDVVTSCSQLVTEVGTNRMLLNRIAYILEANGMTS
jgi:hypothetical protein